jgi:alpha-amylase/alpha-mannosidase (GH57 family)
MNKFLCIHGHFYQPPRDNPWLNEVEMQDSAYPFHDWNERITAECYGRNAASRILDKKGRIQQIVNNYASISFNFGPTLLDWMQKKSSDVYNAILQADKESMNYFNGHGSAIAQVYNHVIMPLANERDKETQVIWGIEDFKNRFGRMPEGMWCGETAVDTPTLEVMAKHGIKFTILSPYQAQAFRKSGDKKWINAEGANIDPKRAYLCHLPSGNTLNLFFYDAPVSQGVAFENLLNKGERFAERLLGTYHDHKQPQLMHIATDGETYGHHHRFGEMALSYAIHHIRENNLAQITVYGEFLEKHPAEYEAEIVENTSWSCGHGVERWKSNCGCNTGANEGWNQDWRRPLRTSFDWLRDKTILLYEERMKKFADEPWQVRNNYIKVLLDRSPENINQFITENSKIQLEHEERVEFLKLLEMQYHAIIMYTSCGWFFDEVTGLESMQDIFYSARAIQLAKEISGEDLENEFLSHLENARSNIPEMKNAAEAYKRFVKPSVVDLLRLGAHYAVSSLFKDYPEEAEVHMFTAKSEIYNKYEAGKYYLAVGKTFLQSKITLEKLTVSFAVLYLGEHNLYGGIRPYKNKEAFGNMHQQITDSFNKGDVYETIALFDKHFGAHNYSFWHLFRDDQRRILDKVLQNSLAGIESLFRQVYENNYPLLQAFNNLHNKIPKQLKIPVDFVLNSELQQLLQEERTDVYKLRKVANEINRFSVSPDKVLLGFIASGKITSLAEQLAKNMNNEELLKEIVELIDILNSIEIPIDDWRAQNILFGIKENNGAFQNNNGSAEMLDQLYRELNMRV